MVHNIYIFTLVKKIDKVIDLSPKYLVWQIYLNLYSKIITHFII